MKDIEVTVQSILPSDEPQGRYHLHVSPESTVEELLKKLCQEAGTTPKAHYCLRSKGRDVLKSTDTIAQSGVQDGAILHWTSESDVNIKTSCRCNTFWVLALGSFIIGTVGIIAICVVRSRGTEPVYDYAIVFDAGSTHTSMFIYKWEGSKYKGTAIASQFGDECPADGNGIAEFASDPSAAGKSLLACLDKAKAALPASQYSSTPIYLGATAGMRLLKIANESACEAILDSVRDTFASTPFQFANRTQSVRIISGSEEGAFSWITSNYVTNAFNVRPNSATSVVANTIVPSIGALDLGGASTQITFIPLNSSEVPKDYSMVTLLFGKNYFLYTHSYLCYGVKEMKGRVYAALIQEQPNVTLIEHPCLPIGYNVTLQYGDIFSSPCTSGKISNIPSNLDSSGALYATDNYTFIGLSNSSECANLLYRHLFNWTSCPYDRCSFNGVYQPATTGVYYAFSNYYYATDFLNLSSSNTSYFKHNDFRTKIDLICNSNWTELQQYPTSKAEKTNLMFYCLQSTYIDLLLYDGYGFNNITWPEINFVSQIYATDIGWTLGYVLHESNNYPADYPEVSMYTWTFAFLMALFCLFIVVSLGLAAHGRRIRRSVDLNTRRMSHYGAI